MLTFSHSCLQFILIFLYTMFSTKETCDHLADGPIQFYNEAAMRVFERIRLPHFYSMFELGQRIPSKRRGRATDYVYCIFTTRQDSFA